MPRVIVVKGLRLVANIIESSSTVLNPDAYGLITHRTVGEYQNKLVCRAVLETELIRLVGKHSSPRQDNLSN